MSSSINAGTFLANPLMLLPSAANAAVTGTGVDVTDYEGIGIVSIVTGAQGSSGVLTFKCETSHDDSTYVAVTSFGGLGTGSTPVTVTTNKALAYTLNLDECRKYVRLSSVVDSGTNLQSGAILLARKKVTA